MICLMDSHAWIEYLDGSAKGKTVQQLLLRKEKLVTMECCLAELKGFCLRHEIDVDSFLGIVRVNSVVLPVLEEHWLAAAEIKVRMRKKQPSFGLIDALLIAKQNQLNCKIVTGDPHFKGLKNVVFLN
ncbi:PIN domain-containing protein [Candidatus Woesearchaeota archaeon]|nr:PIN domain-containing protein [Candidatus Woesearchaeota archaeon]